MCLRQKQVLISLDRWSYLRKAEEQDLQLRGSWSEYTLNALTRSHVVLLLVFGKRGPSRLPIAGPPFQVWLVVLGKRMRLAIDKIIHHDDVILAIIVRTRGSVTCCNSHAGYPSIVIYDAEKR